MKYTLIQNTILAIASLLSLHNCVFADEVTIPITGIRTGVNPGLFTLQSTSEEGTVYKIEDVTSFEHFFNEYSPKPGGAFRNTVGNLSFIGSSNLSSQFSLRHISLGNTGAGIYAHQDLSVAKLKSFQISNITSKGGAIHAKNINILGIGKALFNSNIAYGSGGALLIDQDSENEIIFEKNTHTIFSCNQAIKNPQEDSNTFCNGGAICCLTPQACVKFLSNESIVFSKNTACNNGGALAVLDGTVKFSQNYGASLFINNTALNGGAIYAEKAVFYDNNAMSFVQNAAIDSGGAIYSSSTLLHNQDNIIFEGNAAKQYGGAIYTNSCAIYSNHLVTFVANKASKGGAIFLHSSDPSLHIEADHGDITFINNVSLNLNTNTHHKNAIFINGNNPNITFCAQGKHVLAFYDPCLSPLSGGIAQFNPEKNHTGTILFSGKYLNSSELTLSDNFTSLINQDVTFTNGILSLEHSAHLITQSFTQKGGTFKISPGTSLTTSSQDKDLIISHLSVNAEGANNNTAIIKSNAAIILKGSPTVYDPFNTFYENHEQASKHFVIEVNFTANKTIDTSNFKLADYLPKEEVFGYEGTWQFNLSETSDINKTLTASWNPTGQFSISPQKEGRLVPTSLWSTFNNLIISNSALTDNFFQNNTVIPIPHFNIFASAIYSNFEQIASPYDNYGFICEDTGYNLGVNIPLSSNIVLQGCITKLSGSIYSEMYPTLNHTLGTFSSCAITKNWKAWTIGSSFSYGESVCEMSDTYQNKGENFGTWKNIGWLAKTNIAYAYPRGIHWIKLIPFVNIEYYSLSQNPFIETGYDPRYFKSSKLINLTIPVGVGLETRLYSPIYTFLGNLSCMYSKDILRENPHTTASLILNNYTWNVACKPLIEETLKLKGNVLLKIHRLSVYSSATFIQTESNPSTFSLQLGASTNF